MPERYAVQSNSMINSNEEEAVRENAATSRSATVAEMVRLYRPLLLRIAFRILKNTEDAEDAVQNTFICAFTHAESFRGDCLVSTWLTRITINQALMQLRRNKRRPSNSLDEVSSANISWKELLPCKASSPEDLLLQLESHEHVRLAMARLPDGLRTVTVDNVVSEMSIKQIAQHHGISEAAAKSRLLRARLAIKAELLGD